VNSRASTVELVKHPIDVPNCPLPERLDSWRSASLPDLTRLCSGMNLDQCKPIQTEGISPVAHSLLVWRLRAIVWQFQKISLRLIGRDVTVICWRRYKGGRQLKAARDQHCDTSVVCVQRDNQDKAADWRIKPLSVTSQQSICIQRVLLRIINNRHCSSQYQKETRGNHAEPTPEAPLLSLHVDGRGWLVGSFV
jgi:hypothetical protein